MSLKLLSRLFCITILMTLLFGTAAPAGAQVTQATTFTVNTVNMFPDINPGNGLCVDKDGNCGVMAAMQEANAWSGIDTISIPAGTYKLTGRLEPTEKVTIIGAGSNSTIIDRALDVTDVAFRIRADVTIQNLRITNFTQAVVIANGEANRQVTLSGVRVDNCGNVLAELGPAIINASATSTVTINGSTITDNFSDACGAISNYGSMVIQNSSITANEARTSYGGAICSSNADSTLIIIASMINNNSAINADNGSGGALNLYEGSTSIEMSEIKANTAARYGGGIYVSGGSLNIYQTDISYNEGLSGGGLLSAADSLTINQSLISENTSTGNGGGAYLWSHALITNSTIINNHAGVNGGGIYALKNNLTQEGTFYVTNSTIDGNSAIENGGGIYLYNQSDLMLANVTLTNNTADAVVGDGIVGRGGGFYNNASTLRAKNSIIALNKDLRETSFDPIATDCLGVLSSDGYNLIGYGGGFCQISGDLTGVMVGSGGVSIDPKLGPLTMYIPTNWYRPVLSGPVVDNGNPLGCTDYSDVLLLSDQLDENPRPYLGGSLAGYLPRCDLGAIESFRTKKYIRLPLITK